jgi:hypothetical protein
MDGCTKLLGSTNLLSVKNWKEIVISNSFMWFLNQKNIIFGNSLEKKKKIVRPVNICTAELP